MNKYVAKIIIDGYRLGKEFAGFKFVAVPTKKLPCEVSYIFKGEERKMIVDSYTKYDFQREFDDKFGNGKYVLNYYRLER
jgi:hypothetical protein